MLYKIVSNVHVSNFTNVLTSYKLIIAQIHFRSLNTFLYVEIKFKAHCEDRTLGKD